MLFKKQYQFLLILNLFVVKFYWVIEKELPLYINKFNKPIFKNERKLNL